MILLDTNVVSEPIRGADPAVMAWLDSWEADTLYLAAVTAAELSYGVEQLPPGRRRDRLHDWLHTTVLPMFDGRILPFDVAAAAEYGPMLATARAAGAAINLPDAYIAATARAHGAMVATRDTSPFRAAGLEVINPWKEQQ